MRWYNKCCMENYLKIILISLFLLSVSNNSMAETIPTYNTESSGYHINKYFDLVPNNKNGNKKVVLITIDDGPTKRALEMMTILNKHKAKAIFFVNGNHSKDAPNIIEQEAKGGFTVGNHTWSHMNLKKEKDVNKIKKEIDKNTEIITKLTGSAPRFFRPPYGASSSYVRDLVKKDNMVFMNWSGAALDWESSTKDEKVFLKNVMGTIHDGEILLIHEHPWTVKYLDALLTTLEQKGYKFVDPSEITG